MGILIIRRAVWFWAVLIVVSATDAAKYVLYRSEDHGRSWTPSHTGLPVSSRINSLAESDGTVVAGTDNGIFVSPDSGKNWERSDVPGTNGIRVVATAAVGRHFFAAAATLLLNSTDGGQTWVTNQTFPRRVVRNLFAHRSEVYAGTDAHGVYRTSDLGQTWNHVAEGLPDSSQVLSFASFEGKIFAALYGKGLFIRQQNEKWTRVGIAERIQPLALAATARALIAGHNPGGIQWSEDAGRTWARWGEGGSVAEGLDFGFRPTPVSLDAPIWEMGADHDMVFIGAADGIFYSEDHGRNWTRAVEGLPRTSPGVAFLVRKNFVLAATLSN